MKPIRVRETSLLEQKARRSAAAALAERLLRLGAALVSLALAFLALSWCGLWLETGPQVRMAGVGLFALAALALIAREILRGAPSRREILARIDAADASGARPAASLDDRLPQGEMSSEATQALWALHRRRLETRLGATPIAPPRPGLPQRDPYALRLGALLAAIVAGVAAGEDRTARFASAFDWRGAAFAPETARFDAWLEPPPYTGREPIALSGAPATVAAPINSVLHIRPAALARVEGALAPLAPAKGADDETSFRLTGAARTLAPDGPYTLAAVPDAPPTIAFAEPLRFNLRGTMTLGYATDDDYGVIAAEAQLSRPGAGRTLYPPPQMPLELPRGDKGRGRAKTLVDLSDSPWAGAAATLVLVARDEGGNEGRSEAKDIVLPQRLFTKPLARLLAMERRALALAPDDAETVRQALLDLTQTDDVLAAPSSVFLGLQLAIRGLEGARGDDDLREAADLLWAMALRLEDGDLSQAERELRAAERRLNEALARGASDEEVAKLSQELRDAMDKFMRNALQRAARERGAKAQQPPGDAQEITKDDLDKLLEALDQAIKSGDTALAQKLLDQFSSIMENLQTAPGGQGRERARQLSDIDELAREQQQLRDETYQGLSRGEQAGKPSAGRGKGPQQGQAQKQRELRERLEQELDQLRRSAEGAPSELDDAARAMGQAEQSLGQGPSGAPQAVESQGRALQALRRGADALAKRGERQEGEEGLSGGRPNRDPLGRLNGADPSNARYDPLGLPPAQRARRLQEELRRRLGQPERPAPELDYLQRLLPR